MATTPSGRRHVLALSAALICFGVTGLAMAAHSGPGSPTPGEVGRFLRLGPAAGSRALAAEINALTPAGSEAGPLFSRLRRLGAECTPNLRQIGSYDCPLRQQSPHPAAPLGLRVLTTGAQVSLVLPLPAAPGP